MGKYTRITTTARTVGAHRVLALELPWQKFSNLDKLS